MPKTKTIFFIFIFSAYFFLKVHLHHFSKDKKSKRVTNRRKQGTYYFCMLIERSGSGSIPLTNGSGSGRLKNMWIRIRIRIRNTDRQSTEWFIENKAFLPLYDLAPTIIPSHSPGSKLSLCLSLPLWYLVYRRSSLLAGYSQTESQLPNVLVPSPLLVLSLFLLVV